MQDFFRQQYVTAILGCQLAMIYSRNIIPKFIQSHNARNARTSFLLGNLSHHVGLVLYIPGASPKFLPSTVSQELADSQHLIPTPVIQQLIYIPDPKKIVGIATNRPQKCDQECRPPTPVTAHVPFLEIRPFWETPGYVRGGSLTNHYSRSFWRHSGSAFLSLDKLCLCI